ncbi:MAG: hypothetical protein H6841_09775 [Planctomycetes bacterium]|nr:hypothetical protein [Planctomycetota bacterium]MCB9935676.1 hypothetical protein [Planctomycetota bacterium]
MKLSRFALLFWLGNLLVLAAAAVFLWIEHRDTRADSRARASAVAALTSDEPLIDWQRTATADHFSLPNISLSPKARPVEERTVVVVPPPPPVEKTDEQLKSELEAELNRRFALMRLVLTSSEDYPDIAMLVSGNLRLQWFERMNLKEEYAQAPSAELRRLAIDLKVIEIDEQGVLVNAASFEKPDRRFDVRIRLYEGKQTNSMVSASFAPDGKALKLPPLSQEPPRLGDPKQWPEKLEPKDYEDAAIDDIARHVKATEQGLQILPGLPEDSALHKHGARGGDIVKAINGEAVKSMSDVRRIVRTQYNAGTEEFVVTYERDGVPGTKIFSAPKKK